MPFPAREAPLTHVEGTANHAPNAPAGEMLIAQSTDRRPSTSRTLRYHETIRRYDKGSTFEESLKAMSSKKKSADTLRAEIDNLKEQIKLKSSQLREEDKKKESRRKFLLGELMQEWVKTGKVSEKQLHQSLDTFLTKEEDRQLFDLEAKSSSPHLLPPAPLVPENIEEKKQETEAPPPKKTAKAKSAAAGSSTSKKVEPKQSVKPLKEPNQDHLASQFEGYQ